MARKLKDKNDNIFDALFKQLKKENPTTQATNKKTPMSKKDGHKAFPPFMFFKLVDRNITEAIDATKKDDLDEKYIYSVGDDGEITERWKRDSLGNVVYYKSSDGYEASYKHDSRGNIIEMNRTNGYWFKREYDDRNNITTHKDSEGLEFRQEYDSCGNLIHYFEIPNEKHPKAFEYWKTYDSANNITKYVDNFGLEILMDYDSHNQLVRKIVTGEGEHTWVRKYDDYGNQIYYKDDTTGTEVIKVYYDDHNLKSNRTNYPDGSWIESEYDMLGNETSVEKSDGSWVRSKYDEYGRVTEYSTSDDFVSNSEYDVAGRKIKYTDNTGKIEVWKYVDSNLVEHTKDGLVEKYIYNDSNQLIKYINSEGLEKHYIYDERGNNVEYYDTTGLHWTKKFDMFNRRTEFTQRKSSITPIVMGN